MQTFVAVNVLGSGITMDQGLKRKVTRHYAQFDANAGHDCYHLRAGTPRTLAIRGLVDTTACVLFVRAIFKLKLTGHFLMYIFQDMHVRTTTFDHQFYIALARACLNTAKFVFANSFKFSGRHVLGDTLQNFWTRIGVPKSLDSKISTRFYKLLDGKHHSQQRQELETNPLSLLRE